MRKIIFILIPIGILFSSFKKGLPDSRKTPFEISTVTALTEARLLERVKIIKQFIRNNPKYSNELAFFIDMQIMSGKNRFFVYDLKKDSIIDQGLVAHGLGSETGNSGELKFSNTNNSLCSSLGKYYVGKDYLGKFGKAYKLYGLDSTNSNAFARSIVLHKYSYVPYVEQDKTICHSFGCPMVNEIYYERIEKIIDNSKRNIILDIYY
ncbi:MAG: murein L,D-transpeptidase catalytic domain family protein [Flavobacterium sp.]|uniref:murein L,D-transpeptidase catalytic domain-containing protein n=1 Tax=Flavobacterium sp. TaxID=239 RepID=UPI002634A297|nr:murein L,D-transpeptidase catalytic domain family protein [Flavobacterium sp.]MDD5149362.1 murein L,D-transpeptidase catalytic domain family protein [Flavobacterium sp.]